MRILVTGGAGLVGSHCTEYFSKKGHKVIVLDNLMRSKLFGYNKESVYYNWEYLSKLENVVLFKGDVRNILDVQKAIGGGVDAIIHTAGQPGVPSSVRIPIEDFNINALGTLNVLETARKTNKNTTIVYCSTNKVYGENIDKLPLKEMDTRYIYTTIEGIDENTSTDLTGHTPYGVSKLTGDLYVQEYAHIYGMKTGVFRMSCIYGNRQFGFEDQGWVSWFIIAVLLGKPINIYGDGKQVRDILNAEDLVKAFDKFIMEGNTSNLFNIGGGKDNTLSLLEFLNILKNKIGIVSKIEFKTWRPSDQKVYITNISKVGQVLGWKPTIGVEEGIEKLITWIKQNLNYFI